MTYNDNLILRYLYGLDEKRDYPQSIKRFLIDVGSDINEDRESAINELYGLKNNCKKLAVLSKKFVDAMDKSYMKFTQFHMDILSECDGENGVIKSPYFIEGSLVVYSIKNGLTKAGQGGVRRLDLQLEGAFTQAGILQRDLDGTLGQVFFEMPLENG